MINMVQYVPLNAKIHTISTCYTRLLVLENHKPNVFERPLKNDRAFQYAHMQVIKA